MEINTNSPTVSTFSALFVYLSHMPMHVNTMKILRDHYHLTQSPDLLRQSVLRSIICEYGMTVPCQDIVRIISQSKSEIGCSLIKQ